MRSMKALQKALSRAGSHCGRGGWGHPSRSPLLGGGVRHHLSEAAAQGRETPHSHQPQHQDQWQPTSLSWPSQTQTCGVSPCALWMVNGTLWATQRSPSACSPV
ncbi:GLS2 isoform 12 [Pan troglodytes]|uniref:Glutaminase 2 n=2 Tax=Homininae TaxID=207598 RepID=F8WEU7_HUMAN|nr:glutaminase 2 [Homo sapiens]KAI4066665.1 glutaminase 2 [Homo sapiens]PNI90215.1 GLS2 isoform 12 [Pan troglodytes]